MRIYSLLRIALCALSILTAIAFSGGAIASAGGYTSPQFGYIVAWNGDWQKEDEVSDPEFGDMILLSHGQDYMQFAGIFTDLNPAEAFNDWYLQTQQEAYENVQVLERHGDEDRYSARFTYRDESHTLFEESVNISPIVVGESTLFEINGWPVYMSPQSTQGVKLILQPIDAVRTPTQTPTPTIPPTPTVDPVLATQCAGFGGWYANTIARVDRLRELGQEYASQTIPENIFFLGHGSEVQELADAQFRAIPPPIAADAQNLLTSGLFAYADGFVMLGQQLTSQFVGSATYDPVRVTQGYNRLQEGDNYLAMAVQELNRIATICA